MTTRLCWELEGKGVRASGQSKSTHTPRLLFTFAAELSANGSGGSQNCLSVYAAFLDPASSELSLLYKVLILIPSSSAAAALFP